MQSKNIYDLSEGYEWEGSQEGIMVALWVLNKNIEKLIKAVKENK